MRRNRKDEYGFDPRMETTVYRRDEYSYADEYKEKDLEDVKPPTQEPPQQNKEPPQQNKEAPQKIPEALQEILEAPE